MKAITGLKVESHNYYNSFTEFLNTRPRIVQYATMGERVVVRSSVYTHMSSRASQTACTAGAPVKITHSKNQSVHVGYSLLNERAIFGC